jgi:chromosome segregation ATPase
MTSATDPRTPPRSTSSSWNETDWELTPGIESPTEIRTSDSRLIRAKRESDQALSACRRRINELQVECAKSKEDGKALEESKSNLEKEIQEQQARMTTLEAARAAIEETLESTRLQLEVSTGLEASLKQKLRMKNKELASLEQSSEGQHTELIALRKEKESLSAQLEERDAQLKEIEARTASLQDELKALEEKLQVAERSEASLQKQLQEKEISNQDMKNRLDRGSKYEQILQKKIAEHEQEILGNVKKIEVGGGLISALRDQIKQSEHSKKDTEQALVTLRMELSGLETTRAKDVEERERLAVELDSVKSARSKMQDELSSATETLTREKAEKTRLQSEFDTLQSSHDTIRDDLKDALSHIRSLERDGDDRLTDIEILHDEKASLEADLRNARQTVFSLQEAERMGKSELNELHASVRASSNNCTSLLNESLLWKRNSRRLVRLRLKQTSFEMTSRDSTRKSTDRSSFP